MNNYTLKYTVLCKSVVITCQHSSSILGGKFYFLCYVFSECKVRYIKENDIIKGLPID